MTEAATTSEDASRGTWREAALLPTLVGVAAVVGVVSSLGAPLIPTIARDEHVSLATADWILTSTLVVGAAATPLLGRLADGTRQRTVVLVALAMVVAGCVVSGAASSFTVMIVGRGAQGFGQGLASVTMAVARRHLPGRRVASAIGALSVGAAAGAALGYPLTSVVAEALDYHAAFWFGALMSAATLAVAVVVIPRGPQMPSRRFDLAGAVTLAVAVIGITSVISEGGVWGWTSPVALVVISVSLFIAALWVVVELRSDDPLVDLRQVRNRLVLTADAGGFFIYMGTYLFVPAVVEFVQVPSSHGYGFGASIFVAGLVIVPLSLVTVISSRFIPVLTRRIGPRWVVAGGATVYALAQLFFAFEHGALLWAIVAMTVGGVGMGLSLGSLPQLIVAAVPPEHTGSATGFFGVLRACGLAVGSAVAAAVLLAHTPRGDSLPTVDGFRWVLLLGVGVCVVMVLVTVVLAGKAGSVPARAAAGRASDQLAGLDAELAIAGSVLPEPLDDLVHDAPSSGRPLREADD